MSGARYEFVKPETSAQRGISQAKAAPGSRRHRFWLAVFDRKVCSKRRCLPAARSSARVGTDEPALAGRRKSCGRRVYDLQAKYIDEVHHANPGGLPAEVAAEIRRLALAAFAAIDCAGMARGDFLLSRHTGEIFVNEVNTIPGFTTISMYSKLWEASGVSYGQLVDRLVALALERHSAKQGLRTSAT